MAIFTTTLTTKIISDLLVKSGAKAFNAAFSAIKSNKNTLDLHQKICESDFNEDYARNVISRVFTFRTIINGDRDVYLDQIYHPLKITSPNEEILTVHDGFTLPEHTSSCLVGYAGQGKTITMKKMFLEDLNKNIFFPFFISLRMIDFSKEVSLPAILLQHFRIHGVQSDIDSVNSLLKIMGKVRIYFDGFDEIHHDHRNSALTLLDECISMWKVNVICSSRPDTQVCKKPGFLVYNVNFLEAKDVEEIININVKNVETKALLFATLHGKDFLLDSIRSPILVDIFIVTSVGLGKKPENIVNYYESLFTSLVYKHDYNKIFTRARKSDLTDTQMEQCLSYFAFVAQLMQESNFTYSDMVAAFIDAKTIIGKENEDEKNIIEDVIDITNLITRDGFDNYTFIHKSIQDFYAAKFISTSTEDNQIDFFNEIYNLRPDLNFCYMLKVLTPSFYFPYFIKRKIDELNFHDGNVNYPTKEDVINYIETTKIIFLKVKEDDGYNLRMSGIMSSGTKRGKYPFVLLSEINDYMFLGPGDYNPSKFIYDHWRNNKLGAKENIPLVESCLRKKDSTSHERYEMKAHDYIRIFPSYLDSIDVLISNVSVLINKILDEYDNSMSKLNSKNITTQRMIKSLMSPKKK